MCQLLMVNVLFVPRMGLTVLSVACEEECEDDRMVVYQYPS